MACRLRTSTAVDINRNEIDFQRMRQIYTYYFISLKKYVDKEKKNMNKLLKEGF